MFAFAKNLVKSAEGIINPEEDYEYNREEAEHSNEDPGYGFRVIHVAQSSIAREAGIESFFDFIIGLNGHELDSYRPPQEQDQNNVAIQPETAPIDNFLQEVANCRGRSVSLDVWSAKGRMRRTIMLEVPEKKPDEDETDDGYGLGMSLQWTPLSVADHVWHVLNISKNSPAEKAGLISHADYIISAENGLLAAGGETLLGRAVSRIVGSYYDEESEQQQQQKPPEIELYIYNHDYDTLRPVRIRPNPNWGGTGLLGCGVGYGLLHRLPAVAGKFDNDQRRRSSSIYKSQTDQQLMPPGGTLFESAEDSSTAADYITPANLANAAPHLSVDTSNKSPAGHKRRHRSVHHGSFSVAPTGGSNQQNDLSEYFAEEEQKSREVEGRDNSKQSDPTSTIPPPPKASGH